MQVIVCSIMIYGFDPKHNLMQFPLFLGVIILIIRTNLTYHRCRTAQNIRLPYQSADIYPTCEKIQLLRLSASYGIILPQSVYL